MTAKIRAPRAEAGPLIGRNRELEQLRAARAAAVAGAGSLVLVGGDAGAGKTRLCETVGAEAGEVLRGAANATVRRPHAAIVGALRSHLHSHPDAFESCGALLPHLALLLPELGTPAAKSDRATLVEAIRWALAEISRQSAAVVILDDLQWSDDATLEILPTLAQYVSELRLLVLAAYRADEIPRGHSLRRMRDDLRRNAVLQELAVSPLDHVETGELVKQVLGAEPASALVRTIFDRTQGIPFFVEELTAALQAGNAVEHGSRGVALRDHGDIPVPGTIRDAVVMRVGDLSPRARTAAEVAAVAGQRFDLAVVAKLADESALAELLDNGLLRELPEDRGRAAFRHALVREALYAEIPWLRRQSLHAELVCLLAQRGASAADLAVHYREAGDVVRARRALLGAVEQSCAVHAYRDAAKAGREALELWRHGEEPEGRLRALERYAHCAELAGELGEAARAWRESATLRTRSSTNRALADAQRRLASVYRLQGDRKRALAARRAAAQAFAAVGLGAEASCDRIVAALDLQAAGDHREAVKLAVVAREEAVAANRPDLQARALGAEGSALAKHGSFERGLELVRTGLSLALEHDLSTVTAELYQRLGHVLQTSADYSGAREAFTNALGLCKMGGAPEQRQSCMACMAYALRELGEWPEALELTEQLARNPGTDQDIRVFCDGVIGAIHGFRGEATLARPLLVPALELAIALDDRSMQLDCAAALAWLEDFVGDRELAIEHSRFVLSAWGHSDDRHYAVWGLRHAASVFALSGDAETTQACAEALTRISSESGHRDAMGALACALGEAALLEGDADVAVEQFLLALAVHSSLELPFELAQVRLRAAAALVAAGERQLALEHLRDAYRTARKLGSRPLALRAAAAVADLGESVERRLGRRAAAAHEGGGLSRRELQVLRLAALGRTNREIAQELFLSHRTVEMHIRNSLAKLGCRSRHHAAERARELGILD